MRAGQRRGVNDFDGQRLKAARTAKGWTVRELADKASVTVTVLDLYERGERAPELSTLERLAEALDCAQQDLRTSAGTTLRDLRERAGASQQEAAEAAGLKRSAYGMLEQGRTRTLPAQVAVSLAAFFRVDRGVVEAAHAEAVARLPRPTRLVLEGRLLERLAAHLGMAPEELTDLAQRLAEEGGEGR